MESRKVVEGVVFSRKSSDFCLQRDHGAQRNLLLMIIARDAGKGCQKETQNGATLVDLSVLPKQASIGKEGNQRR